jgi:hypothetical protein
VGKRRGELAFAFVYYPIIYCINDSEIPDDNIDIDPNDYILQHPPLLIERSWIGDLMDVPSQLQDNSFLVLPFYNTFFSYIFLLKCTDG